MSANRIEWGKNAETIHGCLSCELCIFTTRISRIINDNSVCVFLLYWHTRHTANRIRHIITKMKKRARLSLWTRTCLSFIWRVFFCFWVGVAGRLSQRLGLYYTYCINCYLISQELQHLCSFLSFRFSFHRVFFLLLWCCWCSRLLCQSLHTTFHTIHIVLTYNHFLTYFHWNRSVSSFFYFCAVFRCARSAYECIHASSMLLLFSICKPTLHSFTY